MTAEESLANYRFRRLVSAYRDAIRPGIERAVQPGIFAVLVRQHPSGATVSAGIDR